jgi:hypothetical protein
MKNIKDQSLFVIDTKNVEYSMERKDYRGVVTETPIKSIDTLPFKLDEPLNFKNYVTQNRTRSVKLAMNKLRVTETFSDERKVCYDINVEYELKFTGMTFSKDELETEGSACGDVSLL